MAQKKPDLHTAFATIDEDGSGEITIDELEAYAHRMNYKPEFTKKWIKLFDVDKSGTITYEEYCDTLGLKPKQSIVDIIKEKCAAHLHTHTPQGATCFSAEDKLVSSESSESESGSEEHIDSEYMHIEEHIQEEVHVQEDVQTPHVDIDHHVPKMEAFVTLASTDDYSLGALVWASSLRRVGTSRRIVVMVTRTVSESMRTVLSQVFDDVIMVDVLDSRDVMNLDLLTRPDLGVTFTKFHCWRLTQFSKAVFMDADTIVVQNIDDLFEYEEFSASPDPGWPDCFNSGVFVYRPCEETYAKLLAFSVSQRSFDGGDQGLLNLFFSDWGTKDIKKHLPFVYNCVSQAFYSYLPAIAHFHSKVKVVHFIGPVKPWHHSPDVRTGKVSPQAGTGFLAEYLQMWWDIFFECVQKLLSPQLEGLAAHLSKLEIRGDDGGATGSGPVLSERDRQYMWERGEIDYTGRDRFDRIMTKIQHSIDTPTVPAEVGKKEEHQSSNSGGSSKKKSSPSGSKHQKK